MKRFAAAITIPFILSFLPVVHAQDGMRQGWAQLIVDVRTLNLNQVATVFNQEAIQQLGTRDGSVPVANVVLSERASGESATLVDTVTINAQILAPPGRATALGEGLAEAPPGKTHLSLVIEHTEFVLYVVESVYDRAHSFRHVTAAVTNQLGSAYARFTVDEITGSVVGTLKTNGATYRIVPSAAHPGTHLVFRLAGARGGKPQRYIAVSESIAATPLVGRLEERHILAEALADFQPAGYYVGPLAVTVFGREDGQDRLGTMDPALAEDPDAIKALISDLAPLTGARGDEQFVVEKVQRVPDATGLHTTVISFRQILGGLPVRRRQTLELTETGNVRKLRVSLIDELWLPQRTAAYLTTSAAAVIARDAVAQQIVGTRTAHIEHLKTFTTITYDIEESRTLAPMWRSRYVVRDGRSREAYHVRVNLQTGESLVVPLRMDFLMDIYKTIHNPEPTQVLVWEETAIGFVCRSILDCVPTDPANAEYSKPKDYHAELKEIWEALGVSVCCTTMPSRIDTMTEADHLVTQGAAWFPDWNLIAISTGNSQYPGILAHEVGHAYLTSYNNEFYIDAIEAEPTDETGVAMIEGLGDAIGAVYSMMTTYSGDTGTDPWILAEGLPIQRDLTTAREWSWLHNEAESFHNRGMAVGSFYYRLESTGVLSPERLMRLLLEVSATIESGPGSIGEANLREAVDLAIGPTEDELLNAVDYMWFEPLLLIGADVEHWSDPIEDDSHFGHAVSTGGTNPEGTFVQADPRPSFWYGNIFVTDGADGDGASGTYFYVEDDVFQYEQTDFTVELWVHLNGLVPSFLHVLASNNLPAGSTGHWAVVLRDDRPSDATYPPTTGTLQLRAGSSVVESSTGVWSLSPFDWAHVALVRRGDRGIVFLNGTPVIDEASVFEDFTFSLAAGRRISFGGWPFGSIPNWITGWGYYDEVRVTRGARYTEPFSVAWFQPFTRLGTP